MAQKADLLKNGVLEQRTISFRADNQPLSSHPHLFVDSPHSDVQVTLTSTANQILFGRRGTGKTMILRKLVMDGRPNNPDGKHISISVSVPDFKRSSETSERDPIGTRARSLFRAFLTAVSEEVVRLGDEMLQNEGFLSKIGLTNRVRRNVLADRFVRLSEVLKYGVSIPRLSEATFSDFVAYENDKSEELDAGGSIEGKSSLRTGLREIVLPSSGASLEGAISHHVRRKESTSMSATTKGSFPASQDMGFPEIRSLIRDILDTLQADQIIILLDEWDELLDCQVEFAHLMRTCFHGLERVSIKIAAYRQSSRFNNGGIRAQFRGFELGQDIFEAGDLDLAPNDESTTRFFFSVLYRRLLHKVTELEKHYGSLEQYDYNLLIQDIFRNPNVAATLVRGAHGVLRDFIEAFSLASGYVGYDVARKYIERDHVVKAYRELSYQVQENIHEADDVGGFLLEIVKPHVFQNKVPFFLVSRRMTKWDDNIMELVAKRALHVIPREKLPPSVAVDWKGYEISFGLFEDWKRAFSFVKSSEEPVVIWSEVGNYETKELPRYQIQVDSDANPTRLCHACLRQFSSAAHSYIIKRLCPYCYEPQKEEDVTLL